MISSPENNSQTLKKLLRIVYMCTTFEYSDPYSVITFVEVMM